jgi:Holliday junction resolvase RusA-like endonuclease
VDYESELNEFLEKKPSTPWIELDYHPMSTNYLHQYVQGRRVRSNVYENWIRNFPYHLVPTKEELYYKYGVEVWRDLGLEIDVITVPSMDVDNCVKSLQDTLFTHCWDLDNDNNVAKITITRIGICDSYQSGLIRFRLYNV